MRRAAWLGVMAGAAMVVVGAQGARAQTSVPVAMENLAQAYLSEGPSYGKAAAAFSRAAEARHQTDPQAVTDLRYAGLLFAKAGDLRRAANALDDAGRRALALGDIPAAAEIYANAAYIAAQKNAPDVLVLAHRALWLANQEGVSQGERDLVKQRLVTVIAASE